MATILKDLAQHRCLLQLILVLGLGGNLPVGFQVSVIAYPSQDIKGFLNASWVRRHGHPLPPGALTFLWSVIVSIYCLGGIFGCLWSGSLILRHGKKKSQLWADCIVIVGALLIGCSRAAGSFEMILAGRFAYGVAAGLCLNATGPYLAEVSPKRLRGFALTAAVVFFALGKVLGQIMGLRGVLGGPSQWPLLLALSGVPALAQLLALPHFPESPLFLLLQKGDKQGCLQAMRAFGGDRPPDQHQARLEEMAKQAPEAGGGGKTWGVLDVLAEASLRWPLAAALLLALSLQLSGLSAIYFYAFEVFRTARIPEPLIPFVTLGTSICEFAALLLCSTIIDRFGRRVLLWGGFGAMGLAMALLILTLFLQDQLPWLSYISITLIFLFIVLYGIGPAGATFAVMMELFSPPSRPSALVIVGSISWLGLFISGLAFPFLVESLGYFCFLLFLAVDAGMAAFIYFFLPETKGRSVEEISGEVGRISRGGKHHLWVPPAEKSLCTKL